jgi:hypothetical protein
MGAATQQPIEVEIPPRPDLRQSLCHTLLAAGFSLLAVLNPFDTGGAEGAFHSWMMVALGVAVVASWYVLSRRWIKWRSVPAELRAAVQRAPAELRQRAISHLMMALLALLLTAFSFLGRASGPAAGNYTTGELLLFGVGAVVAIAAVAVLVRTLRDLLNLRRADRGQC